ncbi:MAG TPA: EAL domain-containing protein [Gaiellaceae bacterium]|nr:EAL domain-containing protein [Gaiellaceae bacterium]
MKRSVPISSWQYDAWSRIRRVCEDAEVETVFQPLVELDSNECIAFEALARFPNDRSWTTTDWFATARELGVGEELELAAVVSALDHLVEIPEPAALAINVSPAVAASDEFFVLVAPVAHRLIIELTEHERVEDYTAVAAALEDLRRLGARIAVDDVGTSSASLHHVFNLVPDIVKLDLSLTRDIEDVPGAHALASAMVHFASSTGALVAAEGIETAAELALLRELGVDHGQGYLLGKPGPIEAHLN